VKEQHVFYSGQTLRILRFIGAAALLIVLLAEWLIEVPGQFGLHAVYALLGTMALAVTALIIGWLFDWAGSGYDDD
jgi:hypothetical protein